MIKPNSYTTAGNLPNHIVEERGALIQKFNCISITDAIARMVADGNANQPTMNYIFSVVVSGSTGAFSIKGEPVRVRPEP